MTGNVIILGSINIDLLARVPRLPTAGETLTGTHFFQLLGGKGANQAVAAAKAGAHTLMLGAVGMDADGAAMIKNLIDYGVDTSGIAKVDETTGRALVVTSPLDNQIVVIPGANHRLEPDIVQDVALQAQDVCLTQLETPVAASVELFRRARSANATTILNAAPASDSAQDLLPLTDILVVNESELALLSGTAMLESATDDMLVEAIACLSTHNAATVIVTLGSRGLVVVRGNEVRRIPGRPVTVVDTTGAGDCFCGYLAAGLALGLRLDDAAAHANVAASIAVQSLGAASSIPARSAILETLSVSQS